MHHIHLTFGCDADGCTEVVYESWTELEGELHTVEESWVIALGADWKAAAVAHFLRLLAELEGNGATAPAPVS